MTTTGPLIDKKRTEELWNQPHSLEWVLTATDPTIPELVYSDRVYKGKDPVYEYVEELDRFFKVEKGVPYVKTKYLQSRLD